MMTMCQGTRIGKYLSHTTVEPVLFLYMLSTFSQYALFQDLVYSKVCWTSFSRESDICQHLHDEEYKHELEEVQKLSSHWILMSTICLVAPSLLIAMYLGSWSDKFGRKWPVVFPPLGGVCACLVYIIISVLEDASVGWICLASLLSGMTGGFVACISSCMTYVASVTTQENRTARISRLEAMTFFGGTVGPFISGSMLEVTGHAYAFFYMMLCYAFAFLYALLFVKDITSDGFVIEPNEKRRERRGSSADPQMEEDVSGGGRSRNKSSDTIPSSVVTTTSGGDDIEQKESLLSASELHMAIGTSDDSTVETMQPIQHSVIVHHDNELNEGGPRLRNDNENPMMIDVASPHPQMHNNDINNRNSIGSSSGRNSSLQGHDDAIMDDDQRNMIKRSRHSSTLMDDENGDDSSSSLCCCSKYFGASHVGSAFKTVCCKKREKGKRSLLIISLLAGFIFMVITAGRCKP